MITLRVASGSYPKVTRVFAYHPDTGQCLCAVKYPDGTVGLGDYNVSDLEAMDDGQKFHDTKTIVRRLAEYVVRDGAAGGQRAG